jgi:hypothetical protein
MSTLLIRDTSILADKWKKNLEVRKNAVTNVGAGKKRPR